MFRKALIGAIFAILLFPVLALAQTSFEYGSEAELKGVTKIYVFTGPDLELRQNILKEIRKKLPSLIVTDTIPDAEVVLAFGATVSTSLTGIRTTSTGSANADSGYGTYQGSTTSTPVYGTVVDGVGFVVKFTSENRMRLLMQFGDQRTTLWERRPSSNFARAFVKAYQKANK